MYSLSSWWWAEKPPETCRTLRVIKNIVKRCILLVILKRITTDLNAAQYTGNLSFGSTNKFRYKLLTTSKDNTGYSITYVTGNKIRHFPFPPKSVLSLRKNTVMRRLTTGIRSEKCVVRRFRRCANVIECTYTNLDSIAYYKPRLYGIAYCS
jgi:hypothetical protein